MEKKSLNLKLIIEMLTRNVDFPTQLSLGNLSNGFSAAESRELSLNGNVHDFFVDYNSIDKSEVLNIHKYSMRKNNIK